MILSRCKEALPREGSTVTAEERERQNQEDRKWLDKFDADMEKLKHNREKVPLEALQTRYARAYNTLVAEVECDADWWAKRYLEVLAFPRHPQDTAGNEWLDKRIAAILQEEQRPGGRVEQYKKALIQGLNREAFEHLVWEIYDRMEREAFDPYWQRHCFWTGPPGNRWIYNDIIQKFWQAKDKTEPTDGCWINSNYTGQDPRFPPNIKEETT